MKVTVRGSVRGEAAVITLRVSRPAASVLAGACAALAAACAMLRPEPRKFTFVTGPGARRPPLLIANYREALEAVLWELNVRLDLPPLSGTLELFPDRGGMVDALRREGFERSRAQRIAECFDGVATGGRIIASESVLQWQHWPARVAFLAHELAHLAEFELASGRRGPPQYWVREGFAEWCSWTVVDDLALASYGARRRAALIHMGRARAARALAPLAELSAGDETPSSARRWVEDPKYDEAFLAVEFLIRRHGLAAVITYFKTFAHWDDPRANFRAAFGEGLERFAGEFQAHLDALLTR